MTGRQKALAGQLVWVLARWLIMRTAKKRARTALAKADAARLKAAAGAARVGGRRGLLTAVGLGVVAALVATLLRRRTP